VFKHPQRLPSTSDTICVLTEADLDMVCGGGAKAPPPPPKPKPDVFLKVTLLWFPAYL
jgi:hypothetical protein